MRTRRKCANRAARLTIVLAVLIMMAAGTGQAQFNYDRYQPALMDTIAFFPTNILNDSLLFIVLNNDMPLRVRVTYGGEFRTLDPLARDVLKDWMEEVAQRPFSDSMYTHETLVFEAGKMFWIPTQSQLLPYLKKELRRGDTVDLYLSTAGTTKLRVIFSMNEFGKVEE